jgi:predicted nucleic acid-binding protein
MNEVGTIGILDLAAEKRLIDLPQVVSRLTHTNFRIAQRMIEELLQRDVTRQNSRPAP